MRGGAVGLLLPADRAQRRREALHRGWLDDRIEEWLEEKFGVQIDFEVDDALRKLEKKILASEGNRYPVPSIDHTLIKLDELWDGIFTYSNENSC